MSESPLTSVQAIKLLDKNIGKFYWDRFKGLDLIIDKVYDRVKSKKAWEEFQSIGSLPDPQLFNGVIQMQNFSMGYHTKIVPLEYAGGFSLERRLIDTDQSGIIKKLPQQLATAANRKMNKIAHEPFIYPDSAAFTFMTSEEGVALASNSHTTKAADVSTSSGFDNLATYGFDGTNLEALRLQGMQFRDDIAERITPNFDTIVHGSALAGAVWTELNTMQKTGDNLNDKNINAKPGRWKSLELPLLDDYSPTGWGIIDSAAMKDSLIWVDAVPLEFNTPPLDYDHMMRKYQDYFVVAWGFTDWRWLVWSDPA
jgi:hypothetical protein